MGEIYQNAILYGSRYGRVDDFTKRGLPSPTPEDFEKNKSKPVYMEMLIIKDRVIVRVNDVGEGFDPEKVRETRNVLNDYDCIEAIPPEEKCKYLHPHGRGLNIIREITGREAFVAKNDLTSVAFVIYNKA
jgi:hypothetical protein